MMLFKHDSFYTKIFIDDWSCYNIWKNENNSSQLLFDNKFCKGLNKNSIIALNNTSVNHDKQKRRKHVLSFSARPPAKSCIPIFTEKPVAMVTIMQMRWNYTVGHLFPPDIHPEVLLRLLLWLLRYQQNPFPDQCPTLNLLVLFTSLLANWFVWTQSQHVREPGSCHTAASCHTAPRFLSPIYPLLSVIYWFIYCSERTEAT